MGKVGELAPEPSKYASRSPIGMRKKAATKASNQPNRKQGFARVTEDMFQPFTVFGGSAAGLVLVLLQRSGLRDTTEQ